MRADVTRAAGWRGLFGRGRHRRGLISRLSSYRGLGVTARGYVFFFPHFLRSCFIGPSLPDSNGWRHTEMSLLFASPYPILRPAAPPIAPRFIYLIGPGRSHSALSARRATRLIFGIEKIRRRVSRAWFLRNPHTIDTG